MGTCPVALGAIIDFFVTGDDLNTRLKNENTEKEPIFYIVSSMKKNLYTEIKIEISF